MKNSLYGNKMFIVDLIIVTIWAFFNLRLSLWNGWTILLYIPIRIALCFQMQRKSPWTFYYAIDLLFCGGGLAFTDRAFYPFKRLAYYIGAWIGNGKDVIDAFGGEQDQDLKVWLIISGAVLSLWIFGLPILIALHQRNIKSINWKHRWIRVYLLLSVIASILIFNEEPMAGVFMFGFFLCFLPVAYWTIYNRNHRSAFNLICNYKPLVLYIAFIVLSALCLFIGLVWWKFIKAIALIIMPPIFYALICRYQDFKPLTCHAVALSICGGLYFFIYAAPELFKIITLSLSGILALYVAVDIACRYRGYGTGIAIFLMPTAVVAPLVLGMNPYVMLDVDSVSYYYSGYIANDGLFVIEKNGKYGLRDRFGLVLTPKYDKFEKLDKCGHYISTSTCDGNMIADNRYSVFDLTKYEFLFEPNDIAVARLVQTGNLSFDLITPDETILGTLQLRGYHTDKGGFVRETYIKPYHAPAELILEEDEELAEWEKELGDCQHGENAGSYVLLDKARVAVNRKYSEIIEHDSTYQYVHVKWSDLMDSMSDYIVNVTYGEPFYSLQPIQYNYDIRQWYETMLSEVSIDKEILFGDRIYSSSIKKSINSDEIETFFTRLDPATTDGYSLMWNEIKPAFFEWRLARAKYAETLDPQSRLSYERHTDYLTDYFFNEIKGLLVSRNDNRNEELYGIPNFDD